MIRGPLVVVGDVLLDVDVEGTADRLCPDAPVPVVDVSARKRRPGGAGLAALLAAREGLDVTLVTGFGADAHGKEVAELCRRSFRLVPLPFAGDTPCKARVRVAGRSLVRMDSGAGQVVDEPLAPEVVDTLHQAGAVLVADYGRGATSNTFLRNALRQLPAEVPMVWDPHPKGANPIERANLVVPNWAEALLLLGARDDESPSAVAAALVRRWQCGAVAVTLGARGAVLAPPSHGREFSVPDHGELPPDTDVCGAGDSFAVAATTAMRKGASRAASVAEAVAAAHRFVVAGGAGQVAVPGSGSPQARPSPGRETVFDLAERVRHDGGRLVATGGCFDLLHPGHVRLLERARELGDALVVCINSDESVRRLKGSGRPVVEERDRRRLLEALECVDAVAVFDESTPSTLLEHLRPHVWVKGGDYDGVTLSEAEVVRRNGGRTVLIPLLDGYSTSRLLTTLRTAG